MGKVEDTAARAGRQDDGRRADLPPGGSGINKPAEGIAAGRTGAKEIFGARHFDPEINILQRERSFNHPAWLWTVGCLIVLVCSLILIAALTWGAGGINDSETPIDAEPEDRPKVQA